MFCTFTKAKKIVNEKRVFKERNFIMKKIAKADVLICGGGIIGLTIARQLLKEGYKNIIIIEKEREFGLHASGRNSGVLHAGIYYSTDSLKAKCCLKGNLLMKEYCREKGLPLLETGKVIVARDESEIKTLNELYKRGVQNGAKVELIDEKELTRIEPNARTCEKALFSSYTAVVDPKRILKSLSHDLESSKKVKIFMSTRFKSVVSNNIALTNRGEIGFDQFINAGGAYSDKIAHAFGVGLDYKLIPFKGIYRKLGGNLAEMIKGNIYPVPDIRNPFLGVHFTRSINGDVYLGPTAIPAFGRENYGILRGINHEAIEIILREVVLFISDPSFRGVALVEPKKYIFQFFFKDAQKLVKEIVPEDVESSDKSGIRAQLVDWKKKELVMDFKVIKEGSSIHILNSISPAFTSSFDFASLIVKEYVKN